ncbi:hypothetical protein ASG01_12975 [Chryseobacterium sp. Leaf180]|uniref:hypothetical protein n=1 Tax=Chryseobacterium sp. Leaf180 TaxID=1736289 RepID=UPI0006F361E2|nr:hypothetical protein [Chryseobacterium sp. Leaf180]KQR91912.1 hypothetical protein ASG01_12975 [Chryseobacterium sp. Leaf180]
MKKIYSLLFLLLLLNACSFNQSFVNREADKDEAKNVSDKYYWKWFTEVTKTIFTIFSVKSFLSDRQRRTGYIINKVQQEKGVIKGYELASWETLVVKGTNPKNEYVLKYDVQRELGVTHETVSMTKENVEIKIVGYNINIPEK